MLPPSRKYPPQYRLAEGTTRIAYLSFDADETASRSSGGDGAGTTSARAVSAVCSSSRCCRGFVHKRTKIGQKRPTLGEDGELGVGR